MFPLIFSSLCAQVIFATFHPDSSVFGVVCMKYVQKHFRRNIFCAILDLCVCSSYDPCVHAHVHSLEGTLHTIYLICAKDKQCILGKLNRMHAFLLNKVVQQGLQWFDQAERMPTDRISHSALQQRRRLRGDSRRRSPKKIEDRLFPPNPGPSFRLCTACMM